MDKDQFIAIAASVSEGRASREEMALYVQYVDAFIESHPDWDVVDAGLKRSIELEMRAEVRKQIAVEKPLATGVVVPLWRRFAVAAAAMTAITLGLWIYYSSSPHASRHPELVSGSPLANDIAPGKNTATLTLASGKVINLDTNKTSVVVADSVKAMTMLTASTPRGGQYQVVLPDGTKVWLNADSKISFPSQFSGKERKILLEGEAYFEVAKLTSSSLRGDRSKLNSQERVPFFVESAGTNGRPGQQVKVLGTHFNINSYANEGSIRTTLLEGSVQVFSTSLQRTRRNDVVLVPNQQSVLTTNNQITVKQIDPATAVAWKNGNFVFSGEDIPTIMKILERWYDIEVVYEGKVTKELYYADISRFKNISEILKSLENAGGVHFKIEGRRVSVTN